MKSHFFGYLMRMKNIKRWGLMRNSAEENIKEHSADVAYIAHALAAIGNAYYNRAYDVSHIVLLALYHDVSEVITGDLATPIKYFNPEIKEAYKKIETMAQRKLVAMLPPEMAQSYDCLEAGKTEEERLLVKAADKISAYFKCVEESRSGNSEFCMAQQSLLEQIRRFELPEVDYFMEPFADSVGLTLDELN